VSVHEFNDNSGIGMNGTVSACSDTTFVMAVVSSFGSGTFNKWVIVPETGWGNQAGSDFMMFAADRAGANTFYAYNYGPRFSSSEGIYESTDGGESWLRVATGQFSRSVNGVIPRLKTVPEKSGNLFFTKGIVIGAGAYPHPGYGLFRATNHGTTWSPVGSSGGSYTIQEVWDFGFGNACGGDYPAIFLYGWVGVAATFTSGQASISATNNFTAGQPVRFLTTGSLPGGFSPNTTYFVSATGLSPNTFQAASTIGGTPIKAGSFGSLAPKPKTEGRPSRIILPNQQLQIPKTPGTHTVMSGGIWRSMDDASTWQQLTGLHPDKIIDQVTAVEGDANICGRFYFSKAGTGWSYGQFNFPSSRER
jgi:hypothetical protein